MNDTARNFFEKHNIKVSELSQSEDTRIFRMRDVDSIVYKIAIYQERENANISIADILGYDADFNQTPDIFDNISLFFDSSQPYDYRGRSCSLLDIPSSEIVDKLRNSFLKNPIIVQSLEEGKNFVVHGVHRFTVLKSHFLNESYGLDKESEEYQQLRKKYTIPVKMDKIDYLKTYSKFLLRHHPTLKFDLWGDRDPNSCTLTGKSKIELDGSEDTLDDVALIEKVREIVLSIDDPLYFQRVLAMGRISPHFLEYVNEYIPELIVKAKSQDGEIKN